MIVVIGDIDRSEFADVLRSARNFPACRAFADLFAFETWTQTASLLPIVDVILLLQSYSGEHPASVLNRIRWNYPITPVVSVLGAWCEGELRTGWPLTGTHRFYWNEWIVQGEKELLALAEGKFSVFGLPPTYKDEDILLEQTKRKTPPPVPTERQCWILTCRFISRPDFEMCRMLQARMQALGFTTNVVDWDEPLDLSSPPEMILWNPGLVDENSWMKIVTVLKELREKFPQTQIHLPMYSPRMDEIRDLTTNGGAMTKWVQL